MPKAVSKPITKTPDSLPKTSLEPGQSNYLLYGDEKIVRISLKWSDMVDPYAPENETPVGYDFTLDTVATLGYNQARIGRDTKQLPEYREMFPTDYNGTEMWYLKPGPYFVKFLEKVMIPGDMMAYMRPRSTLLRCGIALETAVWDAGYEGKSGALLIVHNPNGVLIERFTRIGHMVMHPLSTPNGLYVGQYQKEGVN